MSYGIGTSLLFVPSCPFPTAHPETALLLGSLQRSDSRASSPLPGPRQHSHKQALGTKPADDMADRDQFCPRKSCGTTVCSSEQKCRGSVREPVCTDCISPPNPTFSESLWWLETSPAGSICATESGKCYLPGLPLPRKELVVTFKAYCLNLIIFQVPLR